MRTFLGLSFAGPLFATIFVSNSVAVAQPSIPVGPVTRINAALQGGSDIGEQINNAVAQLPTGGEVYIPAASTCYQFSVPIVINAGVTLRGDGPATCLTYTGSSGIAMTWTGGAWGNVMRDFTLQTTAGTGGGSVAGTTGILLTSIAGISAFDVNVIGFGTGLTFGSNTWLVSWHDGMFSSNSVAIDYPAGTVNVGENLSFIHTAFFNGTQSDGVSKGVNCVKIGADARSNSSEFNFVNNSFDSCQVVIGENWEAATRFINPHFEDVQPSLDYPFLKITTGLDPTKGSNVVLTNPDFMMDANQVLPEAFIELDSNATLSISNAVAQGWGGISAPKAWIAMKGPGSAILAMSGTFHFVHNYGSIPMYRTDGINQPIVTTPRPSSFQSIPVLADEDVVLAEGNILTGEYQITWGNQNDRYQTMKVSISATAYSSAAVVNILNNYAYLGNTVVSGVRTVVSNGVSQLVATIGNRNESVGPLSVLWSGDGTSQPQILPGTAVGSTAVTSYGVQQMPDGTTGIAGGMKLLPGSQPACNSSNRGLFWYSQGQNGTSDSVQVCVSNAAGSYLWYSLSLTAVPGQPTDVSPSQPSRPCPRIEPGDLIVKAC